MENININDDLQLSKLLNDMKNRNVNKMRGDSNYLKNIKYTNELLINGLITDVMNSIQESIQILKEQQENKSDMDEKIKELNFLTTKLKAELLFFIFYQTQIERNELNLLVSLIKELLS